MRQKTEHIKTVLLVLLLVLNLGCILYYSMVLEIKSEQVLLINSQIFEQEKQIGKLSDLEQKYKETQDKLQQARKENSDLRAETEQLYARIDNLKKEHNKPVQTAYAILPIYLEGDVKEGYAREAANRLKLLPERLLLMIKEKGWSITITSEDIEDTYNSGVKDTIGLTLYYQNKIYLMADSYAIQSCMLHEIGHVVDFMNDFISYGEKWRAIYKEEAKRSGYEAYFCESASEYFAQAFQEYFIGGDILREQRPDTYEFIRKIIDSY